MTPILHWLLARLPYFNGFGPSHASYFGPVFHFLCYLFVSVQVSLRAHSAPTSANRRTGRRHRPRSCALWIFTNDRLFLSICLYVLCWQSCVWSNNILFKPQIRTSPCCSQCNMSQRGQRYQENCVAAQIHLPRTRRKWHSRTMASCTCARDPTERVQGSVLLSYTYHTKRNSSYVACDVIYMSYPMMVCDITYHFGQQGVK